jgi:hypothetical protein
MNSSSLSQIYTGLDNWQPFTRENVKKAPREKGVYVIRQASGKSFGRLHGKSDIFYIGSTTSLGGLRQRLMQYFHPGSTPLTNRRIHEFLMKYAMEVAWCSTDKPKDIEYDLLWKFFNEHDELPPFNRATIRLLHKGVEDSGKRKVDQLALATVKSPY